MLNFFCLIRLIFFFVYILFEKSSICAVSASLKLDSDDVSMKCNPIYICQTHFAMQNWNHIMLSLE